MPAKRNSRKSVQAKSASNRRPAAKSKAKTPAPSRTRATVKRPTAVRGQGQIAPLVVARATVGYDDDDVLPMGGGQVGYGRCGGRLISTHLEQTICTALSSAGVIHSHSPRHFEVRVENERVAAYAPMIVLRGRGREGKTVVIEAAAEKESATIGKIKAFRAQYALEFYVIFVAPEGVVDEVSPLVYDECAGTDELVTLINRLAD